MSEGFCFTELPAGECIEVLQSRGRQEGALAGYAIKFCGSWDAWVWSSAAGMVRLLRNVSREEAIEGIKDHLA